jgi:hypothetical protein
MPASGDRQVPFAAGPVGWAGQARRVSGKGRAGFSGQGPSAGAGDAGIIGIASYLNQDLVLSVLFQILATSRYLGRDAARVSYSLVLIYGIHTIIDDLFYYWALPVS